MSFNKCRESQKKLRQKLTKLSEKGRPLKDETERCTFMDLLEWACLGHDGPMKCKLPPTNGYISGDNTIGETARRLAYEDGEDEDMSKLWRSLRNELFRVFPVALMTAFSASPEKEASEKAKAQYY